MKLVLAKDGIKREIEGPFSLCLHVADRKRLIDILRNIDPNISCGWVSICDAPESHGTVNTPVKKWDE